MFLLLVDLPHPKRPSEIHLLLGNKVTLQAAHFAVALLLVLVDMLSLLLECGCCCP